MTRYNEIMGRVRVTPELRERVLENVEAAMAQPKKRRAVWRPWLAAAACLVLVLLGSLTLPRLLRQPATTEPTGTDAVAQDIWAPVEYASAEALSAAASFPVNDVPPLRDAASACTYTLIGGERAEIDYETADGSWYFRVGSGTEDVSGDYNDYATTRVEQLADCTVTFRGNDGCAFAVWTKNGCSYALSFPEGTDFEAAAALTQAAITAN